VENHRQSHRIAPTLQAVCSQVTPWHQRFSFWLKMSDPKANPLAIYKVFVVSEGSKNSPKRDPLAIYKGFVK
jgi:hypothetical protein